MAAVGSWDYNVQLDVAVTNTSNLAVSSWKLFIPLPAGGSVYGIWNASARAVDGGIEVTNVSYNGSLAAGQSTTFGLQFRHANKGAGNFSYLCRGLS